jgi:hypothetical protein
MIAVVMNLKVAVQQNSITPVLSPNLWSFAKGSDNYWNPGFVSRACHMQVVWTKI